MKLSSVKTLFKLFTCAALFSVMYTNAGAADFVMHRSVHASTTLPQTVKNETQIARERGLKPFVMMYADWCSPCHAIKKHIKHPLMQEAFKGTYVVLINVDEWEDEIKGKYFVRGIPSFFEISAAGEPTGKKIDAGAWEDNTPAAMAPVLNKFFHAQKSK